MSTSRRKGWVRVALVLVAEVAGVVLVHRLGSTAVPQIDWASPGRWVREAQPEDAALAVARLFALVAVYWVLATTAVYLVARLARSSRLVGAVGWATLPGVRRLIDGAVAASIVGTSVLGAGTIARAESPPPTSPPVVVQVGQQPGGTVVTLEHAYVPVPAGDPPATSRPRRERSQRPTPSTAANTSTSAPLTSTTHPSPPPPPSIVPPSPPATAAAAGPKASPTGEVVAETYVVRGGDNLWTIAAGRLAEALDRPAVRLGRGEVARYWLRVVDANRDRIPSRDPDLIHPGESVTLPPPDA